MIYISYERHPVIFQDIYESVFIHSLFSHTTFDEKRYSELAANHGNRMRWTRTLLHLLRRRKLPQRPRPFRTLTKAVRASFLPAPMITPDSGMITHCPELVIRLVSRGFEDGG